MGDTTTVHAHWRRGHPVREYERQETTSHTFLHQMASGKPRSLAHYHRIHRRAQLTFRAEELRRRMRHLQESDAPVEHWLETFMRLKRERDAILSMKKLRRLVKHVTR